MRHEGFFKEVAQELIDSGVYTPSNEQIAQAMLVRIDRQRQIYRELFGNKEALGEVRETIYNDIRTSLAK